MHPVTEVVLTAAGLAVVVVAAIWLGEHVTCFNLLGITKGCVTH